MSTGPGADATEREGTWIALERLYVSAALGERPAAEAVARMCALVEEAFGTRCVLVDASTEAEPPDGWPTLRLGLDADGTAGALALEEPGRIPEGFAPRLGRLFSLLLDVANPIPRGARALHKLRNRLAGVQTNVEFVEMILTETTDGVPPAEQREDVMTALAYASGACREMGKALRELSGTTSPNSTR